MGGTVEGGHKAAATNKARYGEEFYKSIGFMGGKTSRGGGFAKYPELAREAGRKGGIASRRNRPNEPKPERKQNVLSLLGGIIRGNDR